jgi:phosphoribosylformylglycinamidine synthase subunit PurQ / glutaminase
VSARIGVVVFPGSNCEHDVVKALCSVGSSHGEAGPGPPGPPGSPGSPGWPAADVELVWHAERSLSGLDAVVLPGGFAHGDYLRPGAIARFSPVMPALAEFAADGGPVVGICNGFQVLTEAGLLPGALQKNSGLRFICQDVKVQVCSRSSVLTRALAVGEVLRLPVNHFEGNYTCDPATLDRLRAEERIVLRYVDNPNGSTDAIAGICNRARNVVGLMPHPERACDVLTGATDGARLLRSLLQSADERASLPA